MTDLRGILGLALLLLVAAAMSKHRRGIPWRTVGVALALQVGFAALVLRWGPGKDALAWVSDRVAALIGYADEGTSFVFGPLLEVGEKDETIFALLSTDFSSQDGATPAPLVQRSDEPDSGGLTTP